MWIGNLFLVILNLPLAGLWVQILKVPYRFLFPAILAICAVGVYSINYNNYDIVLMAAFALLGYIFYQLRCEPAPLILGFVLGPMMEENLRRAMLLSRGRRNSIFHESPFPRRYSSWLLHCSLSRFYLSGKKHDKKPLRKIETDLVNQISTSYLEET